MKITPLIAQLRDYCPTLASRVAVGICPTHDTVEISSDHRDQLLSGE